MIMPAGVGKFALTAFMSTSDEVIPDAGEREPTTIKEERSRNMSILNVPGAQLYYEVSGDGPLLILIPGAAGTGEVFRPLAPVLAKRYQVVIYDRRGFSHSELDGPQDDDQRLDTDADDVRRLIEQLTDKVAIVFGNSSGATVALQVLIRYPKRVDSVVAHEPPLVNLLPDAAKWRDFFSRVYDTYRQSGVAEALRQFGSGVLGSEDRQVLVQNMKLHANERSLANTTYWMEHELRQYPLLELDLDALAAHSRQLVLVGGHDSQDQMTYQPGKELAQQLGLDIVNLPGGHLGFVAYPAEFAQNLMDALKERA
jgi:acetyltransferase/esterase